MGVVFIGRDGNFQVVMHVIVVAVAVVAGFIDVLVGTTSGSHNTANVRHDLGLLLLLVEKGKEEICSKQKCYSIQLFHQFLKQNSDSFSFRSKRGVKCKAKHTGLKTSRWMDG